jgi:tetratricopeptide (TPR) repeat protein
MASKYKSERNELFGVDDKASTKNKSSAQSKSKKKTTTTTSLSAANVPKKPTPPKPIVRTPTQQELKQKDEAIALWDEAKTFVTKPRFGLFWSPDYGKAGSLCDKAANKLQIARFPKEAAEMFTEAGEYHEKDQSMSKALTSYGKAADLSLRERDIPVASKMFRKVAETYISIGALDRAADSLVTAAKALDGEGSNQLFSDACDMIWDSTEDLEDIKVGARAHEVFETYVEFLIKNRDFKNARVVLPRYIAMLRKNEMSASLCKAHLTSAILDMAEGDMVQAQEAFMTRLGDSDYLKSMECKCEEDMLTSLRTRNVKGLAAAQKMNCVSYLDKQVRAIALGFVIEGAEESEEEEEEEEEEDEEDLDLQASSLDKPPPPPSSSSSTTTAPCPNDLPSVPITESPPSAPIKASESVAQPEPVAQPNPVAQP